MGCSESKDHYLELEKAQLELRRSKEENKKRQKQLTEYQTEIQRLDIIQQNAEDKIKMLEQKMVLIESTISQRRGSDVKINPWQTFVLERSEAQIISS